MNEHMALTLEAFLFVFLGMLLGAIAMVTMTWIVEHWAKRL